MWCGCCGYPDNYWEEQELVGEGDWAQHGYCGGTKVKQMLEEKLPAVQDRDKWRLTYLGKLLEERGEAHYAGCETGNLTDLIDSLCSS